MVTAPFIVRIWFIIFDKSFIGKYILYYEALENVTKMSYYFDSYIFFPSERQLKPKQTIIDGMLGTFNRRWGILK